MPKFTRHMRKLLIAGTGLLLASTVTGVAIGTLGAQAQARTSRAGSCYTPLGGETSIARVCFAGSAAKDPVLTIQGIGFGSHKPTGVPIYNGRCGFGTGYDFGPQNAWVADPGARNSTGAAQPWAAGTNDGDCVGLIIKSWSNTQVAFTFGSRYGAGGGDHWVWHDGDALDFMVKRTMQFIHVPSGF